MKYYSVKVKTFVEETNRKGLPVEKTITSLTLVWAETVGDAETKVHEHLKHSVSTFEIASVAETKYESVLN